ncbi:MAG: DUF2953 domain-containing protein [Lachnospiraceae bacterium]|nr:DUF2953 domain-containing protein [Lachnospiraceae bacterium]
MGMSVFAILKMILLCLFSVAGFILLLLFLVLILPVSYQLKASLKEKIPVAEGKVRWLGPVLMLDFSYNEKFNFSLRILGFSYNKIGKTKKKSKVNNAASDKKSPSVKKTPTDTLSAIMDVGEKESSDEGINSFIEKEKAEALNEKNDVLDNGNKISEKISHWQEKLSNYYEIWKKEETQITFQRAKIRIVKLLKVLLPSGWLVEGEVGFEDPSITGKFMGVLGVAYPFVGNHVKICPDFQEKKLLLTGFAKGRINLVSLIYHIAVFLLNKHCFQFLKLIFGKEEDKIKSSKQEA